MIMTIIDSNTSINIDSTMTTTTDDTCMCYWYCHCQHVGNYWKLLDMYRKLLEIVGFFGNYC